MKHDQFIDPALLDPQVKKIYDIPGKTISMDLSRTRQETGLTFSQDALQDYAASIATFVTTRVMRYWNEVGEPPIRMQTLVSVGIDHTQPVVHDPDRRDDLLDEALAVARSILEVHEHVNMDTPEDKAVHARACNIYRDAIAAIERLKPPRGVQHG